MKTPEELNAIKKEYEALGEKLRELTDDELKQVIGGNKNYEPWSDYDHDGTSNYGEFLGKPKQ